MIKVGVIDCGITGTKLIQAFRNTPDCQMVICADKDVQRLKKVRSLFPGVQTTMDYQDLLAMEIDAIAIAAPLQMRVPLGMAILKAGKHLFIEKPFYHAWREGLELIHQAKVNQKLLMFGHSLDFNSEVNKIKEIIDRGEIGDVQYINSTRVARNLFRPDMNIAWSLAPHEISIISYALRKSPVSVNARTSHHNREGSETITMMTLNYDDGAVAFIHYRWFNGHKIQRMIFSGTQKILVYDNSRLDGKIIIYDRGIHKPRHYDQVGEFQLSLRYGDIYAPRIEAEETLSRACGHFIERILKRQFLRTEAYSELQIAKILESADESLKRNGITVPLQY